MEKMLADERTRRCGKLKSLGNVYESLTSDIQTSKLELFEAGNNYFVRLPYQSTVPGPPPCLYFANRS